MPGFVDNPYKFMSKASVFVLSSIYEGFANVIVEAMACGLSVVSTDCESGPREILEDGKYGKLVPVGDPEALAKATMETIKNPYDKEFLILRARDFSVEAAVSKYLEIIE
jgi:Glycosyltransferase